MKANTIETMKPAIESLKTKGINQTQLNVSKEANLSIRTIKRHWARVTLIPKQGDTEHKKISSKGDTKPTSSGFDTFKRRAASTPTTFTSFYG